LSRLPQTRQRSPNAFEAKYLANWTIPAGPPTGYARILDAAPSASIPDDHEFWNNLSRGFGRSHGDNSRERAKIVEKRRVDYVRGLPAKRFDN
jgi:hypothetical protein